MALPELGKDGFTLKHPTGAHTALLIHGLTATPDEMEPLALLLNKLGFNVHVPRLPGHGMTVGALSRVSTKEFIKAADDAFDVASKISPEEILIVGNSFGSLLGLYLAGKHNRRVKGCVALALPWKLRSANTESILRARRQG